MLIVFQEEGFLQQWFPFILYIDNLASLEKLIFFLDIEEKTATIKQLKSCNAHHL